MSIGKKDNTRLWEEFQRRHPGNQFVNLDPLYSLSTKLIENIKANVKGFFSPEELRFEEDLAKTTRDGFFLQNDLITSLSSNEDRPNQALTAVIENVRQIMIDSRKEDQKDWLQITQRDRAHESIDNALDKKYKISSAKISSKKTTKY